MNDRTFNDPVKFMRWAVRMLDGNGDESRPFDRYCPYCERTAPHSLYAGRVSCTVCGRERPGRAGGWEKIP